MADEQTALDEIREKVNKTENKPLVGKRKIRIVGCSDSKNLCPMNEEGWEYCGVNNLFISMHPKKYRFDRWYEIHTITEENGLYKRRGSPEFRGQKVNDYLDDLAKLPCPVIMQRKWDKVPNSVELPYQAIFNTVGNYITNTIAWQIAHYLYEHLQAVQRQDEDGMIQRIEVWGVDMAVAQPITGNTESNEYAIQKPSCEYWLGLAAGMGVQIFVPPQADLLKMRFIYGLQEPQEHAWQSKVKHMYESLLNRRNQAEQQERHFHDKAMQYRGAEQAAVEFIRIWESGDTLKNEQV